MLRVGFSLLSGWAIGLTLAAQPVTDAAPQLAARISSLLPRRATVSLELQNQSMLTPAASSTFRSALEEALWRADLGKAATQPDARLRVTISENTRGLLFVAELSRGDNRQVVMLPWVATAPGEIKPRFRIFRSLVWEQQDPILDLLLLNSGSDLLVAGTAAVVNLRMAGGKWSPTGVAAISLLRPPARDPRGRIQTEPGGFRFYEPGMTCTGVLQPALKLTCAPVNDAWLTSPRDGGFPVHWTTNRNVLEADGSQAAFYSTAYGWLSTTERRIVNRAGESLNGVESWGSDFASVESRCSPNPVVLAAAPGDNSEHDQIQAYEIASGQAVAASEPITMTGPVTALWPAETPEQVTAVIRNSKTGNYEASRLGVACAE